MSTGCGSPPSSPTPAEDSSRTWSCVTGAAPAARTGSGSRKTGLRNLPLHAFAQNQVWCAIVALATDLLAWMGMLALTRHDARRWEPKRLRLRLFTIPATIARTARQTLLHLSDRAPLSLIHIDAIHRLDR